MNRHLLNCINVPGYAKRRNIRVDHARSVQVHGTTWQRYTVVFPNGETYHCRVRCSLNSQFNDLLVLD